MSTYISQPRQNPNTAFRKAAARAAAALAGRLGPRPERERSHVRLTSNDSSAVLIDSLHTLEVSQLRPVAVQVRPPSLDDVFLLLTGHHAEEAQAGAGGPERRGAA